MAVCFSSVGSGEQVAKLEFKFSLELRAGVRLGWIDRSESYRSASSKVLEAAGYRYGLRDGVLIRSAGCAASEGWPGYQKWMQDVLLKTNRCKAARDRNFCCSGGFGRNLRVEYAVFLRLLEWLGSGPSCASWVVWGSYFGV